jgi:hypothetical protein
MRDAATGAVLQTLNCGFALSTLARLLMLVSVDGCPLPSTVSLSLSTEITAVVRRVGGSSVCPALD